VKLFRPALTLRNRLFLAFLGLALVPLVGASFMAVTTTATALRDKVGSSSRQLVGQIALNLDGEFRKVKALTDEILISPEVSSRMVGYKTAPEADRSMTRFIFTKLLQRKFLNVDDIDDVVMLFRPENDAHPSDLIHTADQHLWPAADLDRLVRTIPATGEVRNLGLSLTSLPGTGKTDIVLVRPIRNALANVILGYLLVVIDPELFAQVYRGVDVGRGADLFVVDRQGLVVSSRHPARPLGSQGLPSAWMEPDLGSRPLLKQWEGQEQLIATAPLGTTGWTVVGAIPSSYLDSETVNIATQVFLFSLVALLLALAVSLQIAEGFTAPLRNLEKTMELFGDGVMQARSIVGRDDEVGRLQRSFNAMASDITGLLARIDEEHRRRQLTELQVLEYQINPHFLYNTLDSINWMAQKADQKAIAEIVTALARFFRLSLSHGRETYRVRDEVEHAQAFLKISQMRYPDCFTYEFDVDPALLDGLTLKIVLQPLVENAIKHGINKRSRGGLIRVVGRAGAGGLEWQVIDNGKGIPEDRRLALVERLASGQVADQGPGGFGLANVSHRIKLNYGPLYGLGLEAVPGGGTLVRVTLPWEAGPPKLKLEDESLNFTG